jgi:pimeloyl-ACP methyl ester carboxylesterase
MGINFAKYDVLRDLNKDSLPILIIHGRQDVVVPIEETISLKEKYKDIVTLEIFDNSNHALSYFEDTSRYHKVTKDFLRKYM